MSRLGPLFAIVFALVACGEDAPAPDHGEVAKVEAQGEGAQPPAATAAPPAKAEEPQSPTPTALPADANPALTDPSLATATAPDTYKVKFETTQGDFVVEVTRAWAPNGAARFYNLVQVGFFDDARFFRNIAGFMVQWGMSAYPSAPKPGRRPPSTTTQSSRATSRSS